MAEKKLSADCKKHWHGKLHTAQNPRSSCTWQKNSHRALTASQQTVNTLNCELFWKNSLFAGLFLFHLLFPPSPFKWLLHWAFVCCRRCCLFFANTYVIIHFGRHLSSSVETKQFSHFNAQLWMCYHCIWSWWISVFLQFSTITVYLAAMSECISGSVEWCQVLTYDFCQSLMGFAFGNRGFLWSSIWLVAVWFNSLKLTQTKTGASQSLI